MAAEPIPTEAQLCRELRDLAKIGYQIGSPDSLYQVPGLMSLAFLGEAVPPNSAMATRRRFDALRSELRDIAEAEVLAELGKQYRDAAIKLFHLDKKRLAPKEAHENLTKIQKGLDEDFGLTGTGRIFVTKHRPKLFEVIAKALIQREERARQQGERGGSTEAAQAETSSPQEQAERGSGPAAATPQPRSESAGKPKPGRKLTVGVLAALLALAVAAVFALEVVGLSGSSSPKEPSADAGGGAAEEAFGAAQQSELFTPTCGVLAHPDPAERRQRLTVVDMDAAGRPIPQPPDERSLPFSRVVQVRPFEVFQASVLIQNAGPAIARNLRLRLTFPTRPARAAAITAAVEATNARPNEKFRTAGVVSLVSPSGEPFQLGNFRYVTAQRNERRDALFWGRFERYEACALEAKQTAGAYEIAVPPPSTDGTLGVGLDDAYRVSVLADVMPG